jgi:hypothetical protein
MPLQEASFDVFLSRFFEISRQQESQIAAFMTFKGGNKSRLTLSKSTDWRISSRRLAIRGTIFGAICEILGPNYHFSGTD